MWKQFVESKLKCLQEDFGIAQSRVSRPSSSITDPCSKVGQQSWRLRWAAETRSGVFYWPSTQGVLTLRQVHKGGLLGEEHMLK